MDGYRLPIWSVWLSIWPCWAVTTVTRLYGLFKGP